MQEYRVLEGDRGYRYLASHHDQQRSSSAQIWTLLTLAATSAIYFLVKYSDSFSPSELCWNAIVFLTPSALINLLARLTNIDKAKLDTSNTANGSEVRAMKSQALRQLFGLGHGLATPRMLGLQNFVSAASPVQSKPLSRIPAGLGNWDNSCYQNSILQGLTALPSFKDFLENSSASLAAETTTSTLYGLTQNLLSEENNGKHIWTPAKLKSMSSWQQQDAQEYFSRILDDIEKEAKQQLERQAGTKGLEQVQELASSSTKTWAAEKRPATSPLEGLLGQRVACVQCGYSEGLTFLPFNCLTVSLGHDREYTLDDRLDDYSKLEDIEGVECISCTLLRQEGRLKTLIAGAATAKVDDSGATPEQSPDFTNMVSDRLKVIQEAIEQRDFTDQALKKCAVPANAKVNTTKTKQVVVGRAPKSLAIHVNRSIFDEMTGALRKNSAFVSYPKRLSLSPWSIGHLINANNTTTELWKMNPRTSMIYSDAPHEGNGGLNYVLKSIVTHYGRHENGHYICFRQHRTETGNDAQSKDPQSGETSPGQDVWQDQWWRLSDEDVSMVSEEVVLDQAGVFMLFYERVQEPENSVSEQDAAVEETLVLQETTTAGPPHLAVAPATEQTVVPLDTSADVLAGPAEHDVMENGDTAAAREPKDSRPPADEVVQKEGSAEGQPPKPAQQSAFQPQKLRTARKQSRNDSFSQGLRVVTAQ